MNKNNDVIDELIELINRFSNIIYERKNDEACKLLINIIDKLDLIVGAKSSLKIQSSYKCHVQDLTSKLPDLLDAFENSDNVLISDILEYEIKPIVEKFHKKDM